MDEVVMAAVQAAKLIAGHGLVIVAAMHLARWAAVEYEEHYGGRSK